MKLFFSDEGGVLTDEIRQLMQSSADEAVRLEFGELMEDEDFPHAAEYAETGVTIVSSQEIRDLNRNYRGIDRVTDVLSFPQFNGSYEMAEALSAGEEVLAGDVVICYDRALEQAEEFGTGIKRELVYLFTHSILHLMGYDHEEEDERRTMREREEEIMDAVGVRR